MPPLRAIMIGCLIFASSAPAFAWGDAGHRVVALIADHYLEPAVRQKIQAMLSGDTSGLAASTDIADEATWADRFRDSDRNTTKIRYELARRWHFVDIEMGAPDYNKACFNHPAPNPRASDGPSMSCVVDRINAFVAELKDPNTDTKEQLLALQFLLHFVGDVHQPLHAIDDNDQGGNTKMAKSDGEETGSLHHYWDAVFVSRLGGTTTQIANGLVKTITPSDVTAWSKGDAKSWALQSSRIARSKGYGDLPQAGPDGTYILSDSYVTTATQYSALQLARAGVRLAMVLNSALH